MSTALIIEVAATLANLLYIILLVRERILCWPFGIVGSLLSIFLFIDARLYSEAILYAYYVGMGVWGWLRWSQHLPVDGNPITTWLFKYHARAIVIASSFALTLGYLFQYYSDAERPYIDAFTTAFSFLATYMEVTKILETWIYWIVINLASIWLYHDRSLDIYAALIAVYSILSVWGLYRWKLAYRQQPLQKVSL